MVISTYTSIIYQINGLISSNKHIAKSRIKYFLSERKLFKELKSKYENDIDFSLISDSEKEIIESEWYDYSISIDEKRKLWVDGDNGLCLIVAYCSESVQRKFKNAKSM